MPSRLVRGVAVGRKDAPRATGAGDVKTHQEGGAPWPAAVTRAPRHLRQSFSVEIQPQGGFPRPAGWRGQADKERKKRAAKGGGGAKRAVGREDREGDVRAGVQRRLRDIRCVLASATARF